MAQLVTVQMLLNVDSECEAVDGANEILREQQDDFAMDSCLVDYSVVRTTDFSMRDRSEYEEGEAFRQASNMGLRELATVLAALRYWQREGLRSAGAELDIATDGDMLDPMNEAEIKILCEKLNTTAARECLGRAIQ